MSETRKRARPLTESEAWRAIARRIEAGRWQGHGLCIEVWELYCKGRVELATRGSMRAAVHAHLEAMPGQPFLCAPFGEVGPRILAAEWLALEAEEAGR